MKFCDIKMVKEQAKATQAGWKAPAKLILRRYFIHFHVTYIRRGKKAGRTSSNASTVVSTTLFGVFIAGSAFLARAEFMR
jgi:hypothetical protein